MNILRQLLYIEDLIYKCKLLRAESKLYPADAKPVLTDDKERYLKMAIRIDPSDMFILCRKREYNLFVKKLRTSTLLTQNSQRLAVHH